MAVAAALSPLGTAQASTGEDAGQAIVHEWPSIPDGFTWPTCAEVQAFINAWPKKIEPAVVSTPSCTDVQGFINAWPKKYTGN